MEIFRVEVLGGNQQTPGLLQNSPNRLRIYSSILFAFVEVETNTRPQAHSADHWVIGTAVFMWHDARVGRIFVDEDVVGLAMRAVGKEVARLDIGHRNGQETGDYRVFQPVWQCRRIEKGIANEV